MGLIRPSRKQSTFFQERTGPSIKFPEKRTILSVRTTTTTDHVVLTVPAGYKVTVLQVLHYTISTSNTVYFVRTDNKAVYVAFVPPSTDFVDFKDWKYEDAPTAYSSLTLDVQAGTLSSTDLNILYAIEPAGEGYFSN
jgi:hypothetical protein